MKKWKKRRKINNNYQYQFEEREKNTTNQSVSLQWELRKCMFAESRTRRGVKKTNGDSVVWFRFFFSCFFKKSLLLVSWLEHGFRWIEFVSGYECVCALAVCLFSCVFFHQFLYHCYCKIEFNEMHHHPYVIYALFRY